MQPSSGSGKGSDSKADDGPVVWESPGADRADHDRDGEPHESRADRLRRRFSKPDDTRDEPVPAPAPPVKDEPVRAGRDDEIVGATAPAAGRAIVTEDDIEVMTRGEDLGIYRAHRRYGGFDAGAAIAGLLAATGMTAVLGGIAGAIGTIGYQLDTGTTETLSTTGFVVGLVVLVVSFLVGGWVAGRVARYDGGLNGLVAGGLFVGLSAIMAGMGAWFGERYDVFADISLPQWFSNLSSATAVLSAVVALGACIVAAWFGGVAGSRYHRKADTYLAEYAQGGRPVTAETLIDDSHARRRHLLHR
jgi:hypothetical protein